MEWEPSTPKWGERVIEALLEIHWNMWEHRNHCLHDPDHPCHADLKTTVDNSIKKLCANFSPNAYLSSDRHLFQQSCSAMLSRPHDDKQLWLESVCAASLQKFNNNANVQCLTLRQDTRLFFHLQGAQQALSSFWTLTN